MTFGRGPSRPSSRPDNPFAGAFLNLQEAVGREMEGRTIRAFHYTRMSDEEVAALWGNGIHLQSRLENLVLAGTLARTLADKLYTQSPFHSDQLESRYEKFWMTSHPVEIGDGGVRPLMAHWGGEVASMWIRDQSLLAPLASIGRPRIVEIAVPIRATRHGYSAGKAVVATFARARGCIPEKQAFDLYAKEPLGPSVILAVHTEGDRSFAEMGRGYPARYVDVSIGRWKELTGQDE